MLQQVIIFFKSSLLGVFTKKSVINVINCNQTRASLIPYFVDMITMITMITSKTTQKKIKLFFLQNTVIGVIM